MPPYFFPLIILIISYSKKSHLLSILTVMKKYIFWYVQHFLYKIKRWKQDRFHSVFSRFSLVLRFLVYNYVNKIIDVIIIISDCENKFVQNNRQAAFVSMNVA